jgi:Tol biopolymer transport system component/DNA-binding winged helix-turn-helix (wHTH) protein
MTSAGESATYEFGPFRLDSGERLLTRDGNPVPLAPKVIDTLVVLVERAGRLLTKEELLAAIWPDSFVDESNLSQNIFRLRRTLGDDQTYIDTVPRRGYRFVHPVRIVTAAPPAPLPPPATPPRRRPSAYALVAMFIAAAAIAISARLATTHTTTPAALPHLERITTDSRDWDPAISPDGRFVAYAAQEGETKSVWLKNLAGGGAVQVMPPSLRDYRGLRFSRDGREIFYKTFRPGAPSGFIERVPILGGAPADVASGVWSDFAVSPDGSAVAFIRGSGKKNENMLLVVAGVRGGEERVVARSTAEKNWFALWDTAPAWSPDGRHIAVCGGVHAPARDREVIFDVALPGGEVSELRTPAWSSLEQVSWLDSATLAVVAHDAPSHPAQLWMLDASSGAARRITNDLTDYSKLDASADGRTIAIAQQTSPVHVWVVPGGDSARARQLTFGAADEDGLYGLSWTPDGRILFVSNRTGEYEIWSMNADGSGARQLTARSAGWNRWPRPTRDGRYVVFSSNRSGRAHIWRVDTDGSNPLQLTGGSSQFQPEVSPDGRWVYYTDPDVTPAVIERVSIDGGPVQRVAAGDQAVSLVSLSPDGSTLTYGLFRDNGPTLALRAVGGGPSRILDLPAERNVARWTPDGRALMYAKFGTVNNLWVQPLDGGEPYPLTHFAQEHIRNFAMAPDGKTLALARGSALSDIVALTRFR